MLMLVKYIAACYNPAMQELFIYLDDSGVLHKNAPGQYFIYAGYVFTSLAEKDQALLQFYEATRKFRPHIRGEIKASRVTSTVRGLLNTKMIGYESFSCAVDKARVYDRIFAHTDSIHRYKDYCIKLMAKAKLFNLIQRGIVNPNADTWLHFFIDNQPTSTDGRYDLREGIFAEFVSGTQNFASRTFHAPIFKKRCLVTTEMCDSKQNYLIQAADFLANAIFTDHNRRELLRHDYGNHTEILLP